jgi:hypothetical protein
MRRIQVLFDRADRQFRFGDEVTGRVAIDPGADFRCRKVEITYAWRTHGKGDRDKGSEDPLELTGPISFRKGERKDFPFRFKPPVGPVTYHGHHLNVDWYVTASAVYDIGTVLQGEEDFLLLAGEPAPAMVLGNREIFLDDLPPWPPQELPPRQGFQELNADGPAQKSARQRIMDVLSVLWISSIVGALVWAIEFHGPSAAWRYAIMSFLAGIVVSAIVHNAYKRKLELGELWVRPDILYAGSQVKCHLDFRIKREVFLHKIEASICAEERVSYTSGTTSVTEKHVLSRKGFVKTLNEQLSGGRQISFECSLPVQADGPPTFESPHNVLEWAVEFRVDLGHWPGLTRRIPITVLPGGPFGRWHEKDPHTTSNQALNPS